jgi:uncharacterized protein YbaR (Trm112 family)
LTPLLLQLLCDPVTKAPLQLRDATEDANGNVIAGVLVSAEGQAYPIVNGIPRFAGATPAEKQAVESFGDEWNHFNFTSFKENWLSHTVANTFGSTEAFRGKLIVDAGGGSGAQTR